MVFSFFSVGLDVGIELSIDNMDLNVYRLKAERRLLLASSILEIMMLEFGWDFAEILVGVYAGSNNQA